MSNIYKIGHKYTDKGSRRHIDDEFLKWINIDGGGMRNADGIRALNYVTKKSNFIPAYLILVSHEVKRHGNPWEDIVDFGTANIKYWGDAKFDKRLSYFDFRGNKRLLQIWYEILDTNFEIVPPILHFSKPQKGIVTFNGLCVLNNLELTWFEDKGFPVKNYKCELTILDVESIEVDWLHHRANCKDFAKLNIKAPKIWKDYIKGKIRKLDVWAKSIKNKENQLPKENTNEDYLLKQLRELTPKQFEAVVVEIFRNLPHVNHKIFRTRHVRDGGFDFYGKFSIPYPVNYEIEFLGEVKKYARNTEVGHKDVSRLVARLSRGQYGIFVTTSYYTKQAQQEVLEDGYPVKLFSGIDIINFLKELRVVYKGKISKEWLESIIKELK